MINSGANLSWLPSMVIIYRFSQAYKLSSRSNNFKIPTAVLDHFTLPVHSMDNIELVPLELITSLEMLYTRQEKQFYSPKAIP